MALKDRINDDINRVFINFDHFAETHTWNGQPIACVIDNETALKRKNNNVVDISWDNNSTEILFYTPSAVFPARIQPNEHVYFDGKEMRVTQFAEDGGIYTILLVSYNTKAVAN